MELTEKAIEELMDAFAKSGLARMKVRDGEQELSFTAMGSSAEYIPAGSRISPAKSGRAETMTAGEGALAGNLPASHPGAAPGNLPAGNPDPAGEKAPSRGEISGKVLTAPLAGVFHRAAKEGDAPIVEPGQKVKKGQTVALMEAMKMVSEVKAPCDGTILEVLAEDGKFCEYREPLMRFGE